MARYAVRVRRIYEEPTDEDGARVLVDRVWPRGVSKESAHLDQWRKDVAPSTELRRWYSHDVDKYDEFRRRYRDELASNDAALQPLRKLAGSQRVTLLTATKDVEHSQATVLAELL